MNWIFSKLQKAQKICSFCTFKKLISEHQLTSLEETGKASKKNKHEFDFCKLQNTHKNELFFNKLRERFS